MKSGIRIIPWIILAVTFIILAFFYNSIENEILIATSLYEDESIYAPKSLLTVFRVPLIEFVCAAAVETARPKSEESDYFSIWNVLLCAVALKSLFQFLEFISTSVFSASTQAALFFYLTLAAVAVGVCLALATGRKFLSAENRKDWELSPLKKIFLVILLVAYFVLAIAPMYIFKTA